ncbi:MULTISPECIES: hypothetical protein [Streptosporangiaceae]|uniref:hypothetical protein n=1 Tax=Streptosporangiaceae TaxID=2004 RepID=UPI0033DB6FAD
MMADYEFPDDLLAAQRAYYKADEHVQEATDEMPSSVDVLAGEAQVSQEQRDELAAARTARLDALDILNRHPFWAAMDNRHAAWMALQKAARG